MSNKPTYAVTGAFGYTGKYIAQRLIAQGHHVLTLTNSPDRVNEFGDRLTVAPFNFEHPDDLSRSLEGVEVLINTYWVRFNHDLFQHSEAVKNTKTLFSAAKKAGVKRVVHVSITNPSESSHLEYFRGKAILERALIESGVSYAILRPTVIFGKEDILLNNIAWVLRHLPVFGLFGDGQYKIQPIYVEDFADLAVTCSASTDHQIINAIGPETFTYRELVATVGRLIGVTRPIIPMPPFIPYAVGRLVGSMVGDVVVTKPEIEGLMAGLLEVESPPVGPTSVSEWVAAHSDTLGRRYTSELARRRDRATAYRSN